MLNIVCKEKEYKGQIWKPVIYHESIKFDIKNWKDIENKTITWVSPFDDQGENNGGFYVFEHGDINIGEIKFGKLSDAKVAICWSGKCNIYFGTEYSENVPFELSCIADINKIRVDGNENDTTEIMEQRLKQFINTGNLKKGKLQLTSNTYNTGIKMVQITYLIE